MQKTRQDWQQQKQLEVDSEPEGEPDNADPERNE